LQREGDGRPGLDEDWGDVEALQAKLASTPSRRMRDRMIEAAAVPLGKSGDPRAAEFLAELVRDRSSTRRVNRAAIQGLKEAGRAAAPPVRDLLKDGVHDLGAVWVIGEVGSADDVELLLPLLRCRGLRLRYYTIMALNELGDDARAVDGFEFALRDRRMFVREKALVALGKYYDDDELLEAVAQARARVPWYRLLTHHTYRQWARRHQSGRR
jgi:HEAT repeat protein